jgi:hypothetical protein
MTSWTVGTYWVNLYAGPGPTRAIVVLFEESGPNATGSPNITLHFPLAALESFLTTLREEKPVYVHVWSPSSVAISTSQEPVGEDEGP